MYLVISHRQAINQLMFSSQLSSFLLSAARVIERSSHLVFGFLRNVCTDKSVKSPEVPAPMKKKDVFIRFLWQTSCRGRRASFFDDQRQNSINWPRLLWSTGRQSSITPGGCTHISFCSSCQLNAFPSHTRRFPWGGLRGSLLCDCSMTLCTNCALLKRTAMCSCQEAGAGDMCM